MVSRLDCIRSLERSASTLADRLSERASETELEGLPGEAENLHLLAAEAMAIMDSLACVRADIRNRQDLAARKEAWNERLQRRNLALYPIPNGKGALNCSMADFMLMPEDGKPDYCRYFFPRPEKK